MLTLAPEMPTALKPVFSASWAWWAVATQMAVTNLSFLKSSLKMGLFFS
jgi:hypothetical protein